MANVDATRMVPGTALLLRVPSCTSNVERQPTGSAVFAVACRLMLSVPVFRGRNEMIPSASAVPQCSG